MPLQRVFILVFLYRPELPPDAPSPSPCKSLRRTSLHRSPLQAVPAQRRPDPFTPCPPAYTSLCAASAARRRASGLPRASLPACVLGLCAASPCSSTAPSLSWCSPLSSPASRTHRIGQEQNRPAGATSFAKFDLYDASRGKLGMERNPLVVLFHLPRFPRALVP
jgi:hypothetical protein